MSNGFIDNYHLKRHIKAVHGEEFVCQPCYVKASSVSKDEDTTNIKFRFKKKKQLAKHKIEVHEKTTSYACKYCSKNFVKEKQYDTHMKRHEEKIQKKNKQILELVDNSPSEEEKDGMIDPEFPVNFPGITQTQNPLDKLGLRKRFKSSDSDDQPLIWEDVEPKFTSTKVRIHDLKEFA